MSSAAIYARPTRWIQLAAIGLPTGLALWIYGMSAAPGLTWAHHGADGGDLLAAAVVNGIPHPSGYPLYTLLLRGWLSLGHLVNPHLEIAYWGNRLSALCMAGAVAFTVATTAALLQGGGDTPRGVPPERYGTGAIPYESIGLQRLTRWLWAMIAGLAFALTPLAWSQALITEVYGLHALLITALGWVAMGGVVFAHHGNQRSFAGVSMGLLMGLGAAHHLTSLLLWPALFYWRLYTLPRRAWLGVSIRIIGVIVLVACCFYGGLVWRMATADSPIPIAWGYPHDWNGLWWLISGAAYRTYLFGITPLEYGGRLAALVQILVAQYTPIGLALVIGGFAVWDRQGPFLRNGALLWTIPISLYAAGYSTADSYIYLLPVVWLMSLMLGQGLASGSVWLALRFRPAPWLVATLAIMGLLLLGAWRLPQIDLRNDHAAQTFLNDAATTLPPGSLVISSADAPTFALWYGQWGSGQLAQEAPNLIIVNHALYQFGWYRKLLHDLYTEVPMMGASFAELIAANRSQRPIYLTEPLPEVPSAELTPAGAFWRLDSP